MAMAIPTSDGKQREIALVEGLRAGDGACYEQLVREYGGAMLAVARRTLRDEDEARDAVQDAMLAAFRAIRFFREDARLSTWLHRITVNACLMKLRSARRRPTERIDDLLPQFDDTGHRVVSDAETQLDLAAAADAPALRARVRACIEKLPESYRVVLLCRDIEELDTTETARRLGLSVENVKTRLHRARQALKTLIERECAELVA
jgi:RNA polymerase sigma-70 factor (ECF subfamily)